MSFNSKKCEEKGGTDVAELNGLMSQHRITANDDHAEIKKEEKEPAGAERGRDGAIPEADPAKIERDGMQQFCQTDDLRRMEQRLIQLLFMKSVRPFQLFSGGDPIKYTSLMASFEEVTNQSAIDSVDKLHEMIHWFDGIIMFDYMSPEFTPDENLKRAKAELDRLYKATVDDVRAKVNPITSGEQLEANDFDGHRHLLAEIRGVQEIINCSNRQFDCFEFVEEILRFRLKHLRKQYLENQMERLDERRKSHYNKNNLYNFDDLTMEIQNLLTTLQKRKPKGTP